MELCAAPAPPARFAGLSSLRLRYQPVVALSGGRLRGLEALARLSAPDGAIIEPADFVPQMEQAGLGPLLADHVRDLALAGLAQVGAERWTSADLRVGFNLPLDCVMAPGTLAALEDARARHGLAARCVTVELTESQPVTDFAALEAAVDGLRAVGYGVAIDDVVPGFPDLDALLDMPFSCVKLDKSLARSALDNGPGRRFIDSIVAAARRGGMVTVAEGIEDPESWVSLRDCGVTCGQGYWVSRPLPYADLPGWIAGWNLRRPHLP